MSIEYVIIDEYKNGYGPFSTREEAEKKVETLSHDKTSVFPWITSTKKWVDAVKNINLSGAPLKMELSEDDILEIYKDFPFMNETVSHTIPEKFAKLLEGKK